MNHKELRTTSSAHGQQKRK